MKLSSLIALVTILSSASTFAMGAPALKNRLDGRTDTGNSCVVFYGTPAIKKLFETGFGTGHEYRADGIKYEEDLAVQVVVAEQNKVIEITVKREFESPVKADPKDLAQRQYVYSSTNAFGAYVQHAYFVAEDLRFSGSVDGYNFNGLTYKKAQGWPTMTHIDPLDAFSCKF